MCLSPEQQAQLKEYAKSNFDADAENMASQPEPQSTEEQTHKPTKSFSTDIVSMLAYLIGVSEKQFGKEYKRSVYDLLERDDEVRVIRSLCAIRNALMRNPGGITNRLREGIVNLDSIPEFIDPQYFHFLESKKVRIITGTKTKQIAEYVVDINIHISNRVGSILRIFPAWINKNYIKETIVMPGGTKTKEVQLAIDRLKANFNSYPFACYINWPIERADAFVEDPENFADPIMTGNVLLNDKKFMVLLYRIHGEEFTEYFRVIDANEETKTRLTDFALSHSNIVVLVDCENSDPYKLCAVMDFLGEKAKQVMYDDSLDATDSIGITKVVLFDDYHTVDAWDVLEEHVKASIKHEEVERILNRKSLVDIAMTAGACHEYYVNHSKAFIVVSSDSDYWGLMRALPDADFMVLAEDNKLSHDAAVFYQTHGVPVCLMDDFASNLTKIKETALRHCLLKRLNRSISLNFDSLMDEIVGDLRLSLSTKEMENNSSYLKRNLQVSILGDGTITYSIKQ